MTDERFNLLIDGYNLMHAAGFVPRRVGTGVFEQQRERFLRWLLKQLPAAQHALTIVVFDGRATTNRTVSFAAFQGLSLQFSPEGIEADDLIESLISDHSAPKQLTVVSSDHRLHRAARHRRAICVDSEDFVDQCHSRQSASTSTFRRRKPRDLSAEELEEWMQVFEGVEEELAPPSTDSQDNASVPGTPLRDQKEVAIPPAPVEPIAPSVSDQPTSPVNRDEATRNVESVEFWEDRLREFL